MSIKKKGFVLSNIIVFIFFILTIVLGGVALSYVNLNYSSYYNYSDNINDLNINEEMALKDGNRFLKEKEYSLKSLMEKDFKGSKGYTEIKYLKDKDIFNLIYNGITYICKYEMKEIKEGEKIKVLINLYPERSFKIVNGKWE